MSRNTLAGRIIENAHRITALKDAITQSYKNKEKNPEEWLEACRVFHASYNQLAFPGGLSEGLDALKKHDPHTIEVAIEYLKADPTYFRSGYNKKQIVHLLKSVPLTKKQTQELQEILLTVLKGTYLLYMEYCRLARKIQDPQFKARIESILVHSSDAREVRRAKKMLQSMSS